ncbi:hypothetical protein MTO96_044350 [Rhipicephalus appendiculatus]
MKWITARDGQSSGTEDQADKTPNITRTTCRRRGPSSGTIHPGKEDYSKYARQAECPIYQEGDYKIVIRPTGGIKLSEHGVVNLTAAVQDAAGIPVEEREEDIICPNNYQNILTASTPNQEHANKYQAIARIKVQGKFYATNAYETAPDMTAKGVIKGIPLEEGPRDITAAVVTTKKPNGNSSEETQ